MKAPVARPRRIRPGGGLGSLRHTMPHLKPSIRLAGGGDIGELYAASRPNLFNPAPPMAGRVRQAGQQLAGQYRNPELYQLPGSTARFQEGGPAEEGLPPDAMPMEGEEEQEQGQGPSAEFQVVAEAMLALEGRHPDPQKALEAFVAAFGEEALQELRAMVQQHGDAGGQELESAEAPAPPEGMPEEDQELQAAGGGLLNGPGSGQSDEIEGETPSGRQVLLSDGEYVIDAATVSALGDGSTSAGARRLDEMRKKIRKQAYGHDKQAKAMKHGGRGIMVELGG